MLIKEQVLWLYKKYATHDQTDILVNKLLFPVQDYEKRDRSPAYLFGRV